jgi:hypothetical protein
MMGWLFDKMEGSGVISTGQASSLKGAIMTLPLFPSYREIPLTLGQVALVSPEDFDHLSNFNWQARWSKACNTFYAQRVTSVTEGRYCFMMHRQILNLTKGNRSQADHINHNGLDNRRCNLRIVTVSQNNIHRRTRVGSSGYRGVCWHKLNNRWVSSIKCGGKQIHLGYFLTAKEASQAYEEAASRLHGEYRV